jgi:NADH dehydrogenase
VAAECIARRLPVVRCARGRTAAGRVDAIVDVTRPETVRAILAPGDVVLHLVGLSPLRRPLGGRAAYSRVHVNGTRNVVAAAERAGARRLVYVSALGVQPRAGAAYAETKARAERIVRAASVRHIIAAPSILFGEGSEIIAGLEFAARLPVVPVPRVSAPFRPVHVEDAARMLVENALADEPPAYLPIVGPERLTFDEVVDSYARAAGRARVSLPAAFVRPVLALASRVKIPGAPAELDRMLAIDNAGGPPSRPDQLVRYTGWVRSVAHAR